MNSSDDQNVENLQKKKTKKKACQEVKKACQNLEVKLEAIFFFARKQRNFRAIRQVRKQDFLFIYDAMLVRLALFPSPMKNLFHSLVFKTILAIINIRTLQFCWLKREVNAASPGCLHIWDPERKKILKKFYSKNSIQMV